MSDPQVAASWWRPNRAKADVVGAPGHPVAFAALIAFTIVLLVSPQIWFPVLKVFRLAFLAAGVAIGVHMLDSTGRRRPAPHSPEMWIALALVSWAIITIPLSYWPGGSVNVLTDQYLKAVIFFWLIGTLVTTHERLRVFAWTLALCSIPLAVTGLQHYRAGEFVSAANASVQRIAGYSGGSGIAGNPNDLALMLNLLIPITGALLLTTRYTVVRVVTATMLLLSIATVIVTFSRAGFVTLAAMVLMALIAVARHRSPGAATAVLVVALSVPPLLPAGYVDRLNTITDISADQTGSAQGRWADFQVAGELVGENPLVGVGMGQDILGLNEMRGRATWRSVHNAYLQYAVDLGVPGLVLFLWFLTMSFINTRRVQVRSSGNPALHDLHVLTEGAQIALGACMVAAFFHPIAYQFYFFCVAGLTVAVKNACRHEAARQVVAEIAR